MEFSADPTPGPSYPIKELLEITVDLVRYVARKSNLTDDPHQVFRKAFEVQTTERGLLSEAAAFIYLNSDRRLLGNSIALLVQDGWIPDQLIPITRTSSPIRWQKHQVDRPPIGLKQLPYNASYLNNVIRLIYGGDETAAPYRDDYCYRLLRVDTKDGNPTLTFGGSSYLKYVNTCEYMMFDFSREFLKRAQKVKNDPSPAAVAAEFRKFRADLDEFDLLNRHAVAGVNTLLVFHDSDEPLMWMHKRNNAKTLAEAVGTNHVVPAGTFQPIHEENSYPIQDFSLFSNIIREIGEELHGDAEITHPVGVKHDIFARSSVRGYCDLLERGLGKIFFAGIGLDCLTLKPEILTIMVISRRHFESAFGRSVDYKEHNEEGKPFSMDFTRENLKNRIGERSTLPAGAGCLYMAYTHFDTLIGCLDQS